MSDTQAPPFSSAAPVDMARKACECGHGQGSHSSLRHNCMATTNGKHSGRCNCKRFTPREA